MKITLQNIKPFKKAAPAYTGTAIVENYRINHIDAISLHFWWLNGRKK